MNPVASRSPLGPAAGTLAYLPLPHPRAAWLRLLCGGASVACLSYLSYAVWMYAQLISRIQGFPTQRMMTSSFVYFLLWVAACNWIASWLLTTTPPLEEFGNFAAMARLRRRSLRLVATVIFLTWSLRVLGLLGLPSYPSRAEVGFWLPIHTADLLYIILLWAQLSGLAGQLGQTGLRVRSAMLLVIYGTAHCALFLVPIFLIYTGQVSWRLTYDFLNLRSGIMVLLASVATLVLFRAALAFWRSARQHD